MWHQALLCNTSFNSCHAWHSSVCWHSKNLLEHVYVIFILADVVVAGTKSYEHSAWWPPVGFTFGWGRGQAIDVQEGRQRVAARDRCEFSGFNFFHFTLESLLKCNFCLISNKQSRHPAVCPSVLSASCLPRALAHSFCLSLPPSLCISVRPNLICALTAEAKAKKAKPTQKNTAREWLLYDLE